jgi:hypothetical protein
MDDFEEQLRAGFERSRSSYEEGPDPFARIARRAKRHRNRRRAGAAIAGACVAAVISVPIALANLGDSSGPSLAAAPTWSARPHEASGVSRDVTGPGQPTEGDGDAPATRPNGAPDGPSSGIATPGGAPSTVPGTPGANPVLNAPSGDVAPNSVPPGGTTTDGGTADGGASDGGETDAGETEGAPPDAPELNRLSPSIASGESAANVAVPGAPVCGGPSALDVGEVGVFTAPDRSADPFSWVPSEPGAFDVVLDSPARVVCASAVTVVAVDTGATGDVTPP